MEYQSTRKLKPRLSASQVIVRGISDGGGLFMPTALPDLYCAIYGNFNDAHSTKRALKDRAEEFVRRAVGTGRR